MISEVGKTPKNYIRMERTGTHKYNTRFITKRVNHVTTFKNAPKMFQEDAMEKIKTHIGTDYVSCIETKEETITVYPMANYINCRTIGGLLGYRDLVNMDEPVWNNSTYNKFGLLSQGWEKHAGTDTI